MLAGFDIGTSAGIGIRASSITADRQHGKLLMSGEQVDEWSDACAARHYVPVSDTHYAAIPRECRGVLHYTVPACTPTSTTTRPGSSARAACWASRSGARSTACRRCPWTLRRAAGAARCGAMDPTPPKRFRNPDDSVGAEGVAFQVDATSPDVPARAARARGDHLAAGLHLWPERPLSPRRSGGRCCAHRAHKVPARSPGPHGPVGPQGRDRAAARAHRRLRHGQKAPPPTARSTTARRLVLLNAIFTSRKGMAERIRCSTASRAGRRSARADPRAAGRGQANRRRAGARAAARRRRDHASAGLLGTLARARRRPTRMAPGAAAPRKRRRAARTTTTSRRSTAWPPPSRAWSRRRRGFRVARRRQRAARALAARGRARVHESAEHVTPIFVGTTDALGQTVPARASLVGLAPMQRRCSRCSRGRPPTRACGQRSTTSPSCRSAPRPRPTSRPPRVGSAAPRPSLAAASTATSPRTARARPLAVCAPHRAA